MATRRKWRRVKQALRDGGGLKVSGLVTPDPDTDWTAPTTGPFPDVGSVEDWEVTRQNWASLSWNPVITPVWNADGTWKWSRESVDVGPKPTWAQMTAVYRRWMKETFLPEVVNLYARRAIAAAYHPDAAHDRDKEWQVRLSGADMTAKDAERVRMVGVCRALEARVRAATTLAQLEAIDYHSDSVWAPPAGDGE